MLVKWSQGWDKRIEKEFSELWKNKEQKSKMRLTSHLSGLVVSSSLLEEKKKPRMEQFGINISDILHIWSAGELAL